MGSIGQIGVHRNSENRLREPPRIPECKDRRSAALSGVISHCVRLLSAFEEAASPRNTTTAWLTLKKSSSSGRPIIARSHPDPELPPEIPRDARVAHDAADLATEPLVHDRPPGDEGELVGILDDGVFARDEVCRAGVDA